MSHDEFKVSSKRLQALSAGVLVVTILVSGRLYQKQILENPQYRAMAQRQHLSKDEIPAHRGSIFARELYGGDFPLATNVVKYELSVNPMSIKDKKKLSQDIYKLINLGEDEVYNKINVKKQYVRLARHLDKVVAEQIVQKDLTGVFVVPEEERFYAEGSLAGQILGFVDSEGKGRYGIEGALDENLKGKNGVAVAEQDSLGRRISTIWQKVTAHNGDDITLTIEHSAQYQAEELLKDALKKYDAKSGTILVMDVETGGIVAMANSPTFDPSNYGKVKQQELFNNPSVSSSWEPGSIMKPIVMAMALDRGVVTPKTTGVFKSHVTVQDYNIWTALKKAYGKENMSQVLQNSDNVAMVWIAKKLGNEWLYRYFKALGFGEKTKVELPAEVNGILPELITWQDINRATMSFGQGITTTPMQMVAAYAAIANDGILAQPHIISKVVKSGGKTEEIPKTNVRRVFSQKAVKEVTDMMVSVVESSHGRKAAVKGYKIAGKTGTAQVPKPGGGYYEDRNIGSFAGFFPANKPKFAMLVKIDYPQKTKWAEASAGPTFSEMAKWLLNYYRIQPSEVAKSGL